MDEDLSGEGLLKELQSARRRIAELEASRDGLRRRLRWMVQQGLLVMPPKTTVDSVNGLVSICAGCKSVRDKQGRWAPVEAYLSRYFDADFTHGICPYCANKVYAELSRGKESRPKASNGANQSEDTI